LESNQREKASLNFWIELFWVKLEFTDCERYKEHYFSDQVTPAFLDGSRISD
jgi:hypothetical protein